MKINVLSRCVVAANSLVLLFTAFLTFPGGATAQSQQPSAVESNVTIIEEGVPGGAIVETVELSAKVIAIDATNRKITLQGASGIESTVKVGPEAVNFDQIEVGDLVKANVTKELIVHLMEENSTMPDGKALNSLGYIETKNVQVAPDGATGIVALAAKGSQPGGLISETIQVTATVTAIDLSERTATLSLEDGTIKTIG